MTIEGDYSLFAHLETVILGVLTRRTLIGTNVRRVVAAAAGKPVLYFPARFDHYQVQAGDGYAAHLAGAAGVSTDAQASWWGGKGIGTVPHGLIAACGGDTVEATRRFADVYYPELNVTALVDFDNDCVGTSLACARALGERLWAVRLDTSETLVDRSLWPLMGGFRPLGVAPELVREVRRALDAEGFERVKIVVSGGFTAARIVAFEAAGVPVDAYGVGSSLLRGRGGFHRRRRAPGWRGVRQGGPDVPPERSPRARRVAAGAYPPSAGAVGSLPSSRSTKLCERRPMVVVGSISAAATHSALASSMRSCEK